MKTSRILYLVLAGVTALLSAEACAPALVNMGIASNRGPAVMAREDRINRDRWQKLVPGIIPWADSLSGAGVMRDTFITGRGDCRLHAMFLPAERPVRRTAVVVHGYSASPYNVMMLIRMYRDSLGFNVLAPSLRHHYLSGGDYVQLGWKDRLDLLQWSEAAHGIFNDTLQVFHGVSMGAATVMMASGEETPDYVRGFVEDCGYSDAWDEFRYIARRYFKRDSLLVRNIDRITERRFDMDIREVSCSGQLAKCPKPMLFIHGNRDELVPVEMVYRNFDAKTQGYKEIWISPGSAHSRAYPDHPAEYTARVRKFLEKHVLSTRSE